MNIEKFCDLYNLGKVKNITKLTGGLIHKMFKVETDKGVYCIKVLNHEVMSRSDAYDNFVLSESISNLAKDNGISVSSALKIDGDYLKELDGFYYMVFDFINGKSILNNEITINDCRKIGSILGRLHSIDYSNVISNTKSKICDYTIDFDFYLNHENFGNMKYKDLYLNNYRKYKTILKKCVKSLNNSNGKMALCHRDMDPKNVMKDSNNNLVVIDWEAASLDNPFIELVDTALCWSGFLNDNFDKEKFKAVISEYSKYNMIEHKRYDTICGCLVSRFRWLEYNLKRSLEIITSDKEEIILGEKEVIKTINEINRYLELVGKMYNILCDVSKKDINTYDEYANKIINNFDYLKGKKLNRINAGFTNSIYKIDNYIIRICINKENEIRFKNEISFYEQFSDCVNIPKLFYSDTSKSLIPYYYEIIEMVEGKTLYEVWYKIDNVTKREIIKKMIDILKKFHLKECESIDFIGFLKDYINDINNKCHLEVDLYNKLLIICEKYFKENNFGIIHNDLHFDNFIYDGDNLHLIDFESWQVGPIDYDFRILSTCRYMPWLWASGDTDILAVESDYKDIIGDILDSYEELGKIPNIRERLDFYAILELLNNYKNTSNEEILIIVKDKLMSL